MAVYGPTTRKAWSEWCNNRLKETNNNQNDSSVANANAQNEVPSSSSTSFSSNLSNSTNIIEPNVHSESESDSTVETIIAKEDEQPMLEVKPIFKIRPKRITATVLTAPSAEHCANDQLIVTNDSKPDAYVRKPGRPRTRPLSEKTKRLVNFNGLDLLHEQTVRSISSTPATVTPPGCIDQKLPSTPTDLKCFINSHLSTDTSQQLSASNCLHGLNFALEPQSTQVFDLQNTNVLSTVHNTIEVNSEATDNVSPVPNSISQPSVALKPIFDLDDLMFRFRGQITQFIQRMEDPVYHQSVETDLEQERYRQQELQTKVIFLETQIREQLDRGLTLLQERLSELNIVASQPEQLVAHAKEIILRNRELNQQIGFLEQQIQQAEQIVTKQQQMQQQSQSQMPSQLQQKLLAPLENQPKKSAVYEQMMEHKRKKQAANNRTLSEPAASNAFNAEIAKVINTSPAVQPLSSVRSMEIISDQSLRNKSLAPSPVSRNIANRNQSGHQVTTSAGKSTAKGSGAPPKHRKSKNSQSTNLAAVNCNGTHVALSNGYSPQTKNVPASFPTPPSNASQDTPTNLFTTNSPSLTSYSIKNMISTDNVQAVEQQQFTSAAHAAYQFPNIEDRIKNMIEAAMNDNSVSASSNKKQGNVSSKPSKEKSTKEPKRGRGRSTKAALATESAIASNNNTQMSTTHQHSLPSAHPSQYLINALSTTASSVLPTHAVTTFNHVNAHSNSHMNSLSARGAIDAQQSHTSQFQPLANRNTPVSVGGNGSTPNVSNRKYSAALEESPREGSALKLTLKIDRERDSYALVKSPPKSPDKQPTSKSSSPKRRQQNGSPEQSAKSRRCRSPKYSSSISSAGEHEGRDRLILKVTNGHSAYVTERPAADPPPGSYTSQQLSQQPHHQQSPISSQTMDGISDLKTSFDTHNSMLYKQFIHNGFSSAPFATSVVKKR